MPFIIHRENLGGYPGLIIPFGSFFDPKVATAFLRDCGIGMRSHCQKETSHKECTLSLLLTNIVLELLCRDLCGGRNISQPRGPMGDQHHFSYYFLNHF